MRRAACLDRIKETIDYEPKTGRDEILAGVEGISNRNSGCKLSNKPILNYLTCVG